MPDMAYLVQGKGKLIKLKDIYWVGSSLDDLKTFPKQVQSEVGYALLVAQKGGRADNTKNYSSLNGVIEIRSNFNKNTYRALYVYKFKDDIYVLHCFQKKSTKGKNVPKKESDTINARYKEVLEYVRKK